MFKKSFTSIKVNFYIALIKIIYSLVSSKHRVDLVDLFIFKNCLVTVVQRDDMYKLELYMSESQVQIWYIRITTTT